MRYFAMGAFVWAILFVLARWVSGLGRGFDPAFWLMVVLGITALAVKAGFWLYDEDHTIHREIRGNKTISWVDYSQPRARKAQPEIPTVQMCPGCGDYAYLDRSSSRRRYEYKCLGCQDRFRKKL